MIMSDLPGYFYISQADAHVGIAYVESTYGVLDMMSISLGDITILGVVFSFIITT